LAGGVEFGASSTGGVTSGAWKIDNQDAFIVSRLDFGIIAEKKKEEEEKGVGWGWNKIRNNNNTSSRSAYVVGVLDGHGRVGKAAALQAKDALISAIQTSTASSVSKGNVPDKMEYERWMENAFQTAAATLLRSSFDFSKSGTTAVLSLIDERGLTVAWAGDSRAVLGVYTASTDSNDSSDVPSSDKAGDLTPDYTRPIQSSSSNSKQIVGSIVAIPLTEDHRPERKSERERILSAGGRVGRAATDAKGFPIGPLRVFRKDTWVPGLAITRAIGDHIAADAGVIPTPEVRHVPLDWRHHHQSDESSPADGYSTTTTTGTTGGRHVLVLASDGVWEWLSSSEVVKIAAEQETAAAAAAAVVEAARKEWAVRFQGRHCDDVTATVVFLPN
jgi:RNA polymerase II C-terminal domain phosphatase-like 3/4